MLLVLMQKIEHLPLYRKSSIVLMEAASTSCIITLLLVRSTKLDVNMVWKYPLYGNINIKNTIKLKQFYEYVDLLTF